MAQPTQINQNFKERLQPVQGIFTVQVFNEHDVLIQEYKNKNTIMTRVPFNFLSLSYGGGRAGISRDGVQAEWPVMNLEDFNIDCIALGTDGVDQAFAPKEVLPNRDRLFSEDNLWDAYEAGTITQLEEDKDKYIYQMHFKTSHDTGPVLANGIKINEGPSLPWCSDDNVMKYYNMAYDPTNQNGTNTDATSMSIKSSNTNLRIDYEFVLGQYAGNGIWDTAVEYSEAALYMKYNPNHLGRGVACDHPDYLFGDPLGALFSMKTFPVVKKTEACWMKIHWTIIFGDADVNIITDTSSDLNFKTVLTPLCINEDPSNLSETQTGVCEL
ncbi:MAG: hypothetical protein DRI86_05640 [Bacteroidetes bacterium]|nr:MAG: hypothetical protein DRI86_05640 [Bacteroidota bacterium]